MNTLSTVEIIGYIGSLLWLLSLTVSNTYKLRFFNLMGASIFSFYGYLSGAYPVFIVNGMIAMLDIYHLYRLSSHERYFNLLEIPADNSSFVHTFLHYYRKSIQKYYPDFNTLSLGNCYAIFTMQNLVPVGITLYEVKSPGIINIKLDFMALKYKELKGVASIYANYRQQLKEKGFREVNIRVANSQYKEYLRSLGYNEELPDGYTLRKVLDG